MDETKLLGEGTELHVDRIAISGTFERVGEAAQIRRREHLGIAVPRADLASDERHADMSVDTNGTMLLKLDPRCADRLDVELAPPLPTYAHAPIVCADLHGHTPFASRLYRQMAGYACLPGGANRARARPAARAPGQRVRALAYLGRFLLRGAARACALLEAG